MSQNHFRQNIVTGGKRGMSQKRGRDMGIIQRVPLSPTWTLAAKEFFSQKRDCQYQKVSDGKIIFKCKGQYRFILYKWCNQYHIKCDHCLKEVVDKEQLTLFMGPLSHIHASILHRITPCMEIDLEDKQAILSKHDDEFDAAYQTLFKSREIKKQPMNAIPTQYKGINFRSRLEAKWAKMFDLLGWKWEYEPFDLDGYIPDFLIKSERPLLVEIKPASTIKQLSAMCEKALKSIYKSQDYNFLGLGCSFDLSCKEGIYKQEEIELGIHLQNDEYPYHEEIECRSRDENEWNRAHVVKWAYCDTCGRYSFYNEQLVWRCEICLKNSKKWDNKIYFNWIDDSDFHKKQIQDMWNQATNLTQYSRIFTTGS
jgi:hypothetical protein